MHPKLRLGLALVLSGGLVGCSTTPPAAKTKVFDYSAGGDSPVADGVVIQSLGKDFSIRASADSWPALVQKLKPTFAWNGCDLMWIQNDKGGEPRFILDEAYIYQPTNQPRQWVLLAEERSVPNEDLRQEIPEFFYSMNNLHGVAPCSNAMPASADVGGKGNYAVAIGTHRQLGTVYEIGWQREMSVGSGLAAYGRRIYVLKDRGNTWHFLGEGPEEGWERGGGCMVESRVIWGNSKTNNLPFQIRFHREETTSPYNSSADDTNRPPDVTICYDTALVSAPPAQPQDVGKNPYLLTEKDATLEKIILRLGYYWPGWEWPEAVEQQAKQKRALEAWHAAIVRLNPDLPQHGVIKEGTRVNLVNPGELENQLIELEHQLNALKKADSK